MPNIHVSSDEISRIAQPPHVVLVTDREASADERVMQTARTMADAGCAITVVGASPSGQRSTSFDGPLRILLVPVAKDVRNSLAGLRGSKPQGGSLPPRLKHGMILARQRRKLWERQVETTMARAILLHRRLRDTAPTAATMAAFLFGPFLFLMRGSVNILRRLDDVGVAALQRAQQRREDGTHETRNWRELPVLSRIRWRRAWPEIADLELSLGPVLDGIEADVMVAHGFRVLRLVDAATTTAASRNRETAFVYDACDDVRAVGLGTPAQRAAAGRVERSHVPRASAVVAPTDLVAESIAAACQPRQRPIVVPTLPSITPGDAPVGQDLRALAGLLGDEPLLVYGEPCSAGAHCDALVDCLNAKPDLHLALLADPRAPSATKHLAALSRDLDCRDRLHLIPSQPGGIPPGFLDSASLGILPAAIDPHAVPRALAEHLHAGLPTLCPQGTRAAELVAELNAGAIYDPSDPPSLPLAIDEALRQQDRFVDLREHPELLHQFSWESASDQLETLLHQVLGDRLPADGQHRPQSAVRPDWGGVQVAPHASDSQIQGIFGLGPRNGNGMAWEWSQALERTHPQVTTEVFAVQYHTGRLDMSFPCHRSIPLARWKNLDWQLAWARHVLTSYSHLLMEQALSVFGRLNGRNFYHDLPMLHSHGITVGLVFRGSEIRDPARHADLEPYSPFRTVGDPLTERLQEQVDTLRPHVDAFGGQTFVTTLDLKDDVAAAAWLPHVIDVDHWSGGSQALESKIPVVAHAPSREMMKGSSYVDEVCQPLAEAGKIEYRRLRGIPFEQMPRTLRSADIVIDQFAIGSYGVLALQAMAAQRVVVGHVSDRVRKRVPGGLPIVEAVPETLESVLHALVADREQARQYAARGLEYARQFHDGRYSARQLAAFLGLQDPLPARTPTPLPSETPVP